MSTAEQDAILRSVVDFYFDSGDFNGYPVYRLKADHPLSDAAVRSLLPALVSAGLVDVMCGNVHPNPHIKAFSTISIQDQLRFLAELEFSEHFCVYPSRGVLASCSRLRAYEGSPYTKELALGSGQLDFRAFDLSVLEFYRNDPRYSYRTNWIDGNISIQSEYFESKSIPESDRVLLQTFGFAHDDDLNRAVAVFLRYLHDLSPDHQRIWAAKELPQGYKLHPDYYRSSILGEFGTRMSIFEAFVQELSIVNAMAATMGRPSLFRETFKEKEPREFGFLLRPTVSEFNRFAQLLDKMMSDNLNKDFFRGYIGLEEEEERADGRIVVHQVGTIQLLEQWVKKYFRPQEPEPIAKMLATFRHVRQARQKPAHSVDEDKFDQKYFREQRQLVVDAYDAVRTLRLMLANHPTVRANPPEINDLLYKGKIWDI